MSASDAIDVWRIRVYRHFGTLVLALYIIVYNYTRVCILVSMCVCICVYISVILSMSMLYVCVYESTVNSIYQLKALVTLVNVCRRSIMGQKHGLIDSSCNKNGIQWVCMEYMCDVCSVYYILHLTVVRRTFTTCM